MPSAAFRPDILKLLGWENWDPLRDEAMANLARKRRIWAEQAEERAAILERDIPPPLFDMSIYASLRHGNRTKFNLDDQKDFGLRKSHGDQDDVDKARSSDSAEDSDSSVDDSDEAQESEGSSDEGGDEEDSEDDDDGDDDEDGESSSEEDDEGDKKTQLRK
ncbi:hypothetical protein NCS57_00544700 [Fusarium keratoplasticum]|uniref:Uncharacterized protein n=1 Tax=Fusarium keratoplasticum TaxID=1328300 RepID=A0ACC0R0H8_9HYPO|nr:hypothetical protein NCS57_00544700 [Fusarium keratoplasticum]KAI8670719.1 hypothetical protein NCS57_00544700 [Fusarium keratoplasticum]